MQGASRSCPACAFKKTTLRDAFALDVTMQHTTAVRVKGVLDWYFTPGGGQYWKDLEQVRDSALEYLTGKETFKEGDATNMVVFDIDETVLSNLGAFQVCSLQVHSICWGWNLCCMLDACCSPEKHSR